MKNYSETAVLGWLSVNGLLQLIANFVEAVKPILTPLLTMSQIAVAIATVVLLYWKIRSARRAAKGVKNDE